MKKNIVKLRILGMATFLIYLLSVMFSPSNTTSYKFTQIQQLMIIVSLVSFAIVMAMQVYRFYIKTYAKEDDEEV